jgi:gas vesicle protein
MDKKDFAAGIAAGAIIGAMAGILLAPKSGKETRDDIKKFVDDSKTKIANKVKEVGDLTKEQYEKIVDLVVDEGSKTIDVTKEDLGQLKSDLKERYNAVKERLQTGNSK